MNLNYTKVVAGAAIAGLLLPTVAMAHDENRDKREDRGLRIGTFIGLGNIAGERDEKLRVLLKDGQLKVFHGTSTAASSTVKVHATSTVKQADAIERKGTRLAAIADLMGSLSSNLAARIASSSMSASSTAAAQANLSAYINATGKAKTEALSAVSLAASIGSTTATSTASTTLSQARADLKEARTFLKEAHKEFRLLIRAIVNAVN